eukprot:691960-Pelagomonas_calceolata.AAC.1
MLVNKVDPVVLEINDPIKIQSSQIGSQEAEGQVTAIIAEQQAAAAAQQQQQQYAEARHSGAGGIQHKQEPQGI